MTLKTRLILGLICLIGIIIFTILLGILQLFKGGSS